MKHYYLFKLRAVLLLFALLCSMPNVWADDSGTIDGTNLTWAYNSTTKTLTISGSGDMNLPETWRTWTTIEDYCQTIIIESGVSTIGDNAFNSFDVVSSVSIPNTVVSIGEYAFRDCKKLTSIIIPNGVLSIGEYCFWGCDELESAQIPNTVTSIGKCAFCGC